MTSKVNDKSPGWLGFQPPAPSWGLRENRFCYTSLLIILGIAAFNRFALSPGWATTEAGNQFIEFILPLYPGLRELKQNWAGYTPQLGVLFSSMFASIPVHFLLGLANSFSFSEENFKKCVCDPQWKYFFVSTPCVFALQFLTLYTTYVDGYGRQMSYISQTSESVIVLTYTWFMVMSMPYIAGNQIGLIYQKAKFQRTISD